MMNYLNNNIQYIKGVGEKRAQLFNRLGIFCVNDLISFYPRKYQDLSNLITADRANFDEAVAIKATLVSSVSEEKKRKGLTLFTCNFSDGKNVIHVTIFNNKYLANSLKLYHDYILFGKVDNRFGYISMASPIIEPFESNNGIKPIYSATDGLNSNAIAKVVKTALGNVDYFQDTLTNEIKSKYNLCALDWAIRQIHFPTKSENIEIARKRLIFDELLTLQLGLKKLQGKKVSKNYAKITKDYTDEFCSLLPFSLTNAQTRAIKECLDDIKSDVSMNRLIQGDVGSGKTAVAGAVVYSIVKNGFQAAMMAPTEILATQHYESFKKLFRECNINIELLTGSTTAKEKKRIKSQLIDGEIDFVVGTHALIQNDIEFKNLALVVTDEQHRFGVEQRAHLATKGHNTHLMVMSATPIPRTLALIIYGDLDISILNELPPGRQKIRTDVVDSTYHERIYNFIKKEVDAGHQAYIVCSLVEEGENDLIPAKEYAEMLQTTAFKDYKIGLLNGRMKPKQKDEVMRAFSEKEVDILVSTTVIEVGVDVPNATIIMIENAERFGLSQLHQLRGRVGRGSSKSYCILVSDSKSENSKERLKVMKSTNDGFKIADFDLKLRGPGDFFGKRQHGLPEFKIADMLNDMETLKLCQQCATDMIKKDERLDSFPLLCDKINDMFSIANY